MNGTRPADEREAIFRAHLRDLRGAPLLTEGEELAAAATAADGRDAENELAALTNALVPDPDAIAALHHRMEQGDQARATLIDSTRRLVVSLARRHEADVERSRALLAAGDTALGRAVDRYDPTGGLPFSAFARWWVERAMREVEQHPVDTDQRPGQPSPADPALLTALGHMHREDCQVIELRLGLNGGPPLSAVETAAVMGVDLTAEQDQEEQALAKLRHPSTPGDLKVLKRL